MHRPHLTREQPLTIGLPVYNGEPFLSDALESLLGQTYGDFTLVVSDNASTDRTVEIVQQFAEDDNRIVLVRNKANMGAAWNLNHVFEYCRSPYFKWAAADDLLAPTCLERLIEVLASSPPSVVAAYPITQLIDVDGEAIRTYHDNLAAPPGAPPHLRLRQVLRNLDLGNVLFAMFRAGSLRRTRLHGSFPSGDYVLLAELALAGEFREVSEPLFLRRIHENTSTRANPTTEALTAWLDPARRPVRFKRLTLLKEHLAGIHHADLTRLEKARAYTTLCSTVAKPYTRLRRLGHRLSPR